MPSRRLLLAGLIAAIVANLLLMVEAIFVWHQPESVVGQPAAIVVTVLAVRGRPTPPPAIVGCWRGTVRSMDLLERITQELRSRLAELRPAVEERAALERVLEALERRDAASASTAASGSPRRRGRPPKAPYGFKADGTPRKRRRAKEAREDQPAA